MNWVDDSGTNLIQYSSVITHDWYGQDVSGQQVECIGFVETGQTGHLASVVEELRNAALILNDWRYSRMAVNTHDHAYGT